MASQNVLCDILNLIPTLEKFKLKGVKVDPDEAYHRTKGSKNHSGTNFITIRVLMRYGVIKEGSAVVFCKNTTKFVGHIIKHLDSYKVAYGSGTYASVKSFIEAACTTFTIDDYKFVTIGGLSWKDIVEQLKLIKGGSESIVAGSALLIAERASKAIADGELNAEEIVHSVDGIDIDVQPEDTIAFGVSLQGPDSTLPSPAESLKEGVTFGIKDVLKYIRTGSKWTSNFENSMKGLQENVQGYAIQAGPTPRLVFFGNPNYCFLSGFDPLSF